MEHNGVFSHSAHCKSERGEALGTVMVVLRRKICADGRAAEGRGGRLVNVEVGTHMSS